MLPAPAFEYYKKIILFASSLHLFPYSWKWDKKTQKFVTQRTTASQAKYWTQTLVMLFYQLVLVCRSWSLGFDKTIPLAKKFGVQNLIFTFIGMNYNLLNTLVNSETFPLLINSFVNVTRNFEGDCGKVTAKKNGKEKESVSRSISFVVIPGILFAVANVLAVFRRPDSPLLLTSLASEPRKLPLVVRTLYLIFHSYLQCLQYTMPVFHLVTVICYVEAVQPMIHDLSLNDAVKERRYSENKNVFEEEDINHFYHELSILQQIFNASYSYWALGAQTFLTVFCIANIFQAGALQNPRGLLNAMFQMFLIKLIFKHLAQIYESSAPTLESWRETKGSVWFQKYLRACKPLRVVVGSFYYADNTLILTMISVISANAASMIVAYKGA